MGEAKIDHLRVPAEHVHGDETVLWLPSFLSLESCCFESAWNNHYHELGTERAICLIQVCVCVCATPQSKAKKGSQKKVATSMHGPKLWAHYLKTDCLGPFGFGHSPIGSAQ